MRPVLQLIRLIKGIFKMMKMFICKDTMEQKVAMMEKYGKKSFIFFLKSTFQHSTLPCLILSQYESIWLSKCVSAIQIPGGKCGGRFHNGILIFLSYYI